MNLGIVVWYECEMVFRLSAFWIILRTYSGSWPGLPSKPFRVGDITWFAVWLALVDADLRSAALLYLFRLYRVVSTAISYSPAITFFWLNNFSSASFYFWVILSFERPIDLYSRVAERGFAWYPLIFASLMKSLLSFAFAAASINWLLRLED